MRLSLQKNSGRWRLSDMQQVHLDFLRQAANDASMRDCPGGRERLYPSPLSGREELVDDEFNEDWRELVAPELEMQFAGDVGIFLSDLDSLQSGKGGRADEPRRFRLDVPLEHGPAWFSTLNQARLLLDLKYKLHEPRPSPKEPAADDSSSATSGSERFLILMRYEFYAWIQEWLVRHVL